MARYSEFLYGSGATYGGVTTITSVTASGPSTGGNKFKIKGSGLQNTGQDDDFTDATLSASRWVATVVGSGSYTVTTLMNDREG